jgi:hypothetical protein
MQSLPRVVESFEKGELSYARARAITRVATPQNEEALVETARHSTGAQLERICRGTKVAQMVEERSITKTSQRSVSYYWDDDGMLILRARLEADEGAAVIAALDAAQAADWNDRAEPGDGEATTEAGEQSGGGDGHGGDGNTDGGDGNTDGEDGVGDESQSVDDAVVDAAATWHATTGELHAMTAESVSDVDEEHESSVGRRFTRADALVAVAETYLAHQRRTAPGADVYQVVVHLQDGQPARLEDGPGLDPPTTLRLICDATLSCVHRDADGNVLDVGRSTRKIPSRLRKALWERDGGCRFPGCGRRRRVDGHHVQHWSRGGPTALHNLTLLCRRHHRAIHREEFSVVMFPDGQPRFFTADGTPMPEVPIPVASERPVASWHQCDIAPDAVASRWGGEQVDLNYVVAVLCQRRPVSERDRPSGRPSGVDVDEHGSPAGSQDAA